MIPRHHSPFQRPSESFDRGMGIVAFVIFFAMAVLLAFLATH